MNKPVKKIAIVGPESTGKSTISSALARYFNTLWVPEFARYYCARLTEQCTMQDEVNMFHGQLALEDAFLAVADQEFIFCDTTFLTVKIWSDEILGETPAVVLDELPRRNYDFYILLDIDLPWVHDPLRDFPHMREHFMQVWHRELKALNARYAVVGGIENRLENAIAAVNAYLGSVG